VTPAFFVPGQPSGSAAEKLAYAQMREDVGVDAGATPRARRIFSIDCRVAGQDCVVQVGSPDPVDGVEILAIFDVGGDMRYSVCTGADGPHPALRLSKRIYGARDFSAS